MTLPTSTFSQRAAVAISIICIIALTGIHYFPAKVPDNTLADAIKAALGICIYFLFGSTASSQKKDSVQADHTANLIQQLGNSTPIQAAIPVIQKDIQTIENKNPIVKQVINDAKPIIQQVEGDIEKAA